MLGTMTNLEKNLRGFKVGCKAASSTVVINISEFLLH